MRIAYIGTSYQELRTRARQIAAWLSTKSWVKLIINDETDKYYLAKVTSEISLESLWESGTADIAFDCQPFAYSINDVDVAQSGITETLKLVTFTNQGTREINFKSPPGSKYIITAIGSWTTITFDSNGKTLTYSKAGDADELIINNVDMTVFQNGISSFEFLSGDIDSFLEIVPGANTVTVSGTGLSLDLEISYIPLWI
jgi:phage-related protein